MALTKLSTDIIDLSGNTEALTIPKGTTSSTASVDYLLVGGGGGGSSGTTGNSGGVESESLGDAISKIYVGRKKNSVPTEFVKSEKNLYSKSKMKSVQPYQGKRQTLLDMFPT